MTNQLNKEQYQAVTHIEGPLLVLAGAGSGKTRVVTSRISYLIEKGVPPSSIVAVTFTNKAAEEMRTRVKQKTNLYVLTATFHSLGAYILRESIHHMGYRGDFVIYDQEESEKLLKTLLKELSIPLESGALKEMKGFISKAKGNLLFPKSTEEIKDPKEKFYQEIYGLYQEALKRYNALDFDDLISLPVALFQLHETVLLEYQKRWRFFLIDEYQDTNFAQYSLIKLLAAKEGNVTAVGDPDQSIYSWRGANLEHILSFEKDFLGAKTIFLEENYRSTSHILKAASHLIQNNTSRFDKSLWSSLGEGEKVTLKALFNERDESSYVTKQLLHYHQERGVPLSDIAIFYRTNAQSRPFEDAFLKHEIPYTIIGGVSFYQRKEIKDLLAYLRFVASETDFLAFIRSVNLPKRGIGPATLSKVKEASERCDESIFSFLLSCLSTTPPLKLSPKQHKGLTEYIATLLALKKGVKNGWKLSKLIEETMNQSGYKEVLKEDPESAEERRENIHALIAKAMEWEEESPKGTLTDFLEELSLNSATDEMKGEEKVPLMTLHNGKGLEFTSVFMTGMEEDLFPHINAKYDNVSLEEERRLCYVGMTRAKRFLTLTSVKTRTLWGTPRSMRKSRFLSELPQECLKRSEEASEEGLSKGQRVSHPTFGEGIVTQSGSTSLGETADVLFDDDPLPRTLILKYAHLKVLS